MEDALQEIKKQVFQHRPVLKAILEEHSKATLRQYVRQGWQVGEHKPDDVFLAVLEQEASELYNPELAKTAVLQLKNKPLVSTIDHLGIWGHPFFVNSDVIYSLAFGEDEIGIVLATESVSLNNNTSRSASLFYHEGGVLRHSSFLPDKLKNQPVFSASPIMEKDINRFNSKTQSRFKDLIEDLEIRKSSATSLSAQTAQISNKLWQKVFPSAPKMLYLPLETLISKYLLEVLKKPDDFFHHLLLTKEGRGLWKKYFPKEHTFMFWGIDEKGKRQAVSSLTDNTDELLTLINSRKIYPASPLCFIVLLKVGLTCAGGYNQTTRLTEVKLKLMEMLVEMGEMAKVDVNRLKLITTTNFAESYLAWLRIGDSYIAPSSVDLYLAKEDYYPKYAKLSGTLTLGQSFELALPDIYRVVVPKDQQMTEDDLVEVEKGQLLTAGDL